MSFGEGDLHDRVDELEHELNAMKAENDALEAELRMARGEVKNVLHNTAAAKVKNEKLRAELERKLAMPVDEALKHEADRFKALWQSESAENMRLRGVLEDIAHFARTRKVE